MAPQKPNSENKMQGKLEPPSSIELQKYIDSSNNYYQNLLGYYPTETKLQTASFNKLNHQGIYFPRNQTATIQEENPLSLFHEYFGHGLFCEQSLVGRKLVDLEKKLLDEEKQEFNEKKFTLEELKEFRKQNKTFLNLDKFRKENLAQYELFAVWTEYLLSEKFNLKEKFGRKYDAFSSDNKQQINNIINFSEQYGDLATFYASGLARRITPKRVKRLLEEIYGEKAVNNSKLVLLTGSKKPFSDIDLFTSSNYLQPIKNNWLDLVVFNEEDFEERIKLFEVQITHPIINGEFVLGDRDYLKLKRNQLKNQPITEEAIKHNLMKSKENEKYANKRNISIDERENSLSYSQTYLANALALRGGKRIFTKEELVLYSQSEKFIELKGGIIR